MQVDVNAVLARLKARIAEDAVTIAALEARVAEQGAVCLTPLHVWRRPWHAVSFSNVSLIRPEVLSGEGRVLSRETSTLCPAAPARSVVRFESVAVQYRSLPLLRRRATVLGGERAACLQHMLDLFKGVSPCEH
jgi:peptide deformylase